jgi:hypothetical protein
MPAFSSASEKDAFPNDISEDQKGDAERDSTNARDLAHNFENICVHGRAPWP